MNLVWKPFTDGRMAVGGSGPDSVLLFFDGGSGHCREDSYSCRMTPGEARVLAMTILAQVKEQQGHAPQEGPAFGRLVIGRQELQSVLIGDEIEVCLVEVRPPDYARLCITAPKSIPIFRPELLARIRAEGAISLPLPITSVSGTKEVHLG